MKIRNSLVVYRKDMLDILRDKRSLRSMVIIPIVAFPLLMLVVGYIGSRSEKATQREASAIMVQGGEDSPLLMAALAKAPDIKIEPYQADAREEVNDQKIRALVTVPPGFDAALASGKVPQVQIGYYEENEKSEMARDRLQTFFQNYREEFARRALEARGVPPTLLEPFQIDAHNIAAPTKVGAARFGGFILYLVILLCFSGGMYPALDLTAGEKERGTMETILTSPISRADLALGKFLTVFTASIVTTVLSMGSLGFVWAERARFGLNDLSVHASLNSGAIFPIFIIMLPLAVLFAAVLLAVALYAKSYREAQGYVSPLFFFVIVPGIVGMLPGIDLSWKTAFIPILNVCVLSKQLIAGSYPWVFIAAIFGMTCVYAVIALSACVRLFNREDVLFRS